MKLDLWRGLARLYSAFLLTLFVTAPSFAADTLTFIHTDVAGSPVAATDQNGAIVWREDYRPYGERVRNQAAAASNRQFFHGKAVDPETGLSYFGARYYDPVVGRFMGVDAVGLPRVRMSQRRRSAAVSLLLPRFSLTRMFIAAMLSSACRPPFLRNVLTDSG